MTHALETIHEHTIATNLLTLGGHVLDAGCRYFDFARAMAGRGCKVIAMDPDPTIEPPTIEGVQFIGLALSHERGERAFVMSHIPDARHLGTNNLVDYPSDPSISVGAVDIEMVAIWAKRKEADWPNVAVFDAVKLDVEGAEYRILEHWPGPVAKQISVEFHEHCYHVPADAYDKLLAHLGQWYDTIQHERSKQFGGVINFWNSLWILKGLA